jgi:hypothetical protein
VEDTWWSRDLPVLDAAVRLLEESFLVRVAHIAELTGMDPTDVARALTALEGRYVGEVTKPLGPGPGSWCIMKVTAAAREAVGQWPTPESVVVRLAEEFDAAAEHEMDRGRRKKMREIANFLADTGKEVAAEVVGKVILHQRGMA